ncbi:MAG: DNA internalization-related competence protein ComEC/Rec2 [Acidobacteriota bacterium]|nr:DNA internalization-related competence protein ComEC/Rec2 [Acidobacteriota bacterium]
MPLSLNLAIAVSAGVAAGVFLDPSLTTLSPWVVVAAMLIAVAAYSRNRADLARWPALIALAAICSILAAAAQDRALHPPLRNLLEQRLGGFAIDGADGPRGEAPIVIEGTLLADATPTDSGAAMRMQVERVWLGECPEPAAGGVSLGVSGSFAAAAATEWRAGRLVKASALLRRPARYLNDGVPDQERLLARRGIALVGSIKSAALVEVIEKGTWFDETAAQARAAVRSAMARHVGVRAPQSAAVATAILIGDRGSLDPEVERRLQEAGTYHVIAISGGNIAILAGLVLWSLRWLRVGAGSAAATAIAVLVAYAFIAGGGPSVVRATVMAAIYLSLRMIDQRTAPAHAMALTAAVLLVVSPLSIADVGFWLTFGATAAIVVGVSRATLPTTAWLRAPVALVLASACAEAVLAPVGALVFQRVTLAGLLLNLAAVPCMALVQVGAMVTAAADAVGAAPIASAAGWLTHLSVRGLVESAALVDFAPWLTWRVPSPPLLVVTAYYACVVFWLFASWSSWPSWFLLKRWAGVAAAALFLWISIAPQTLARIAGDGRLRLTAMDVGQGDAFLVTFPNGRTLMVDTGGVSIRGDFDIGDRVLGPALRARGLARLDYLSFTHGDPDHIGGAGSLARDFAPLEIWDGVFVANHAPTMTLRSLAARRRAAWRSLQRGDRLNIAGVEIRIHHPPPPDWERQKVRNDDSLVIELRYGQVSMLLTGDIGREVEQALVPTLDLLPIVVLKSPHHGSGTSSSREFVEAIKPKVVVISCGRGNPYGHPVPYVLDRYKTVGAQVFRTDLEGQIEVSTDGTRLVIETFTGRKVAR